MLDVVLPLDFPPRTLIYVPVEFRSRHAAAWDKTLKGVAARLPGWCKLEEGRSKLLLMEAPARAHLQQELGERFALWNNGLYADLLSRAERQLLLKGQPAKKQRKVSTSTKGAKARRQIGEGAYRKAMGTLSTDAAQLTVEEQRKFATMLLPRSDLDNAVCQHPDFSNASEDPFGDAESFEHPMTSVKYAPMTAPGPTGTRPEHAKEAFDIKQKSIARRLARNMAQARHYGAAARGSTLVVSYKAGVHEKESGAQAATSARRRVPPVFCL